MLLRSVSMILRRSGHRKRVSSHAATAISVFAHRASIAIMFEAHSPAVWHSELRRRRTSAKALTPQDDADASSPDLSRIGMGEMPHPKIAITYGR
jgi:hypothetical protein